MREPVKIKISDEEDCFFCDCSIDCSEGVIYYRTKVGFGYQSVATCEPCWRRQIMYDDVLKHN